MSTLIRGGTKGSSSALSAVTPPITGWTAATSNTTGQPNPQPGDLVVCHGFVQAASGTWSQTADAGNPWTFHTTGLSNSGGFISFYATRVWTGTETGPTFTFSGTAGRGVWAIEGAMPDAGNTCAVGVFATDKVTTVAATSFTPNSAVVGGTWSSTLSLLTVHAIAASNGTTADSATFPTGWGTDGLAAASLAGTSTTKSSYQQNADNDAVTGTVAPGSVTTGVSSVTNIFHLLITENPNPVTITLSDSGAGSDAAVVSVSLSASDSAASSDAVSDSASSTLSDPAASIDALATSATIAASDSGHGADALVDSASIAVSDSASSANTLVNAASLALADSGSSADVTVDSASVLLPDSGSGLDSFVLMLSKSLADSAVGSDTLQTLLTILLLDYGEGIDAVAQCAHVSDSGQGADSIVVSVQSALPDSALGSEQLDVFVVRSIGLPDAGSGADTIAVAPDNTFTITLGDSASGADALAMAITPSLADSGSGQDTISVSVSMFLGFDNPCAGGSGAEEPIVVVAQIWRLTPELFQRHLHEFHGGQKPANHARDHENGLVAHIHR